jgi:hypothetical protein
MFMVHVYYCISICRSYDRIKNVTLPTYPIAIFARSLGFQGWQVVDQGHHDVVMIVMIIWNVCHHIHKHPSVQIQVFCILYAMLSLSSYHTFSFTIRYTILLIIQWTIIHCMTIHHLGAAKASFPF